MEENRLNELKDKVNTLGADTIMGTMAQGSAEDALERLDKLNDAVAEHNNTDVENDTMKVFFNTISESGIDVSVDFYTFITNYIDYLKFKEDINYIILDLANKQGIKLAYPSQSIYVEKE